MTVLHSVDLVNEARTDRQCALCVSHTDNLQNQAPEERRQHDAV